MFVVGTCHFSGMYACHGRFDSRQETETVIESRIRRAQAAGCIVVQIAEGEWEIIDADEATTASAYAGTLIVTEVRSHAEFEFEAHHED